MSNCRCNYNNDYRYDYSNSYNYRYGYNMSGTYSNKIRNGGFEEPIETENGRKNWEVSDGVETTSIPSLVHTGNYAVMLNESATMSQTMFRINPSRQYEFSFFAKYGSKKGGKDDKDDKDDKDGRDGKDGKDSDGKKGPDHRQDLGLRATVTYVSRNMQYDVCEMDIPAGSLSDDYVYYRALTPVTPPDVIAAIVRFNVSDSQIRPHVPHHLGVLIDDVSFTRH